MVLKKSDQLSHCLQNFTTLREDVISCAFLITNQEKYMNKAIFDFYLFVKESIFTFLNSMLKFCLQNFTIVVPDTSFHLFMMYTYPLQ